MEAGAIGNSTASAAELQSLAAQVRELERRVAALEHGAPAPEPLDGAAPHPIERIEVSSDAIPLAGFALLGIAGAYLLRALSELGTLPRGAGVSAGLLYAAGWLWLAARTPVVRRFAVTARVSTSVLIFAPLVWESTVRFQTLPPWLAAGLLVGFCVAAESVSWRKDLRTVAAIAPAACALLALALLIGTYALAPFASALLAIAATIEFAAIEDRATAARWLVAGCADLAVLTLILLMTRRGGLPEGYAPVNVATAAMISGALLVIYTISAAARTLLRGRQFGYFEIGQTAAGFVLGLAGIVALTGTRLPAGIATLAAGASCYAMAAHLPESRNKAVYAAFGLLLLASAPWLALSGIALTAAWSLLAVLAIANESHAALLLWLALTVSQVASASALDFFNGGAQMPMVDAATIIAAAAICYWRTRHPLAALFIAAALACAGAGALASVIHFPGAPALILILTAALLAWAGAARRHKELVWLMYGFMAAAGFRILGRDLPSSTAIELVAPLLLFGAALILLPRILQRAGR